MTTSINPNVSPSALKEFQAEKRIANIVLSVVAVCTVAAAIFATFSAVGGIASITASTAAFVWASTGSIACAFATSLFAIALANYMMHDKFSIVIPPEALNVTPSIEDLDHSATPESATKLLPTAPDAEEGSTTSSAQLSG